MKIYSVKDLEKLRNKKRVSQPGLSRAVAKAGSWWSGKLKGSSELSIPKSNEIRDYLLSLPDYDDYVNRIETLIKRIGISAREASIFIGRSPSWFSLLKTGKSYPDRDFLERVISKLGSYKKPESKFNPKPIKKEVESFVKTAIPTKRKVSMCCNNEYLFFSNEFLTVVKVPIEDIQVAHINELTRLLK